MRETTIQGAACEVGRTIGRMNVSAKARNQALRAAGLEPTDESKAEFDAGHAQWQAEVRAKHAPVPQGTDFERKPAALTDGAAIYCDAAEAVEVSVGARGKKLTKKLGGARIGLCTPDGWEAVAFNRRCLLGSGAYDSVGGECYAVLKAVEEAVHAGLTHCTIRSDWVGGFDALESGNRQASGGAKYLAVARQMATEHNLAVTFDRCTSEENRADRLAKGPRTIHRGKVIY